VRYSITFLESTYELLLKHLLTDRTREHAAYLLCRTGVTEEETRLLVREILPVPQEEILSSSLAHMEIRSVSFTRAMKRAHETKQNFVFVHSHPQGHCDHSAQDDAEEAKLFRTAYIRIGNEGPHASIVISAEDQPMARVWLADGSFHEVDVVRTVGSSLRFFRRQSSRSDYARFFDRQVRAFGADLQAELSRLNIGIVGVGGTGSSVAEQLARLGVGHVNLFDGDVFDDSNVSRVYGSSTQDAGTPKTEICERSLVHIGLGTQVSSSDRDITFRSIAGKLKECDVIFGCTDDEWGRSILTRIALYYYIPVFDMGVRIDSQDGIIRTIQGRVTTLLPGAACLFCRGRLSSERVAAEVLQSTAPARAEDLRREGYIPELDTRAPAVIAFTTAIAASAVSEFLHRLTGFMGQDRTSTEVLHLFDESRIRTNHVAPDPNCICADELTIGRGDSRPFLDLTWRSENC
jgi:hypothetical protein